MDRSIKGGVNALHLHLLQGMGAVVTRLAPPPVMMENPQVQAPAMNFNENAEGDGDPKTGNTCNALSGKTQHSVNRNPDACPAFNCNTHSLSPPPPVISSPQVHSQVCPTSLVSGARVGGAVSTRRFPAAAWPPPLPSTRRCTA